MPESGSMGIYKIRYNGADSLPDDYMTGLPHQFQIIVEGYKFDQRGDALQLGVFSMWKNNDIRIFQPATAFQSDGNPTQTSEGHLGPFQLRDTLALPGWAGSSTIAVNNAQAAFYPSMELLFSRNSGVGDWFRTTCTATEGTGQTVFLRDPLPLRGGWGLTNGGAAQGAEYIRIRPGYAYGLPIGAGIYIEGRRYQFTGVVDGYTGISPALMNGFGDNTTLDTDYWAPGSPVYAARYDFNRTFNIIVLPSAVELVGGYELNYIETMHLQFGLLHLFSNYTYGWGIQFKIKPPLIGAVEVLEQVPRAKDGSTRILRLIPTHPLLAGARLALKASTSLKNKPKTQTISGVLEFGTYQKSVEVPVTDPTNPTA